ncbi:RND family efflux transporter MFP subunit [Halanaerobium saccharolyticum]|uniref:RND family efflux transporter MFP subunit n=1 Tax=Halanaerobium saccharolyticum TaxID=43595 RepID=A0A4R7YQ91_9FIRM|nr:efflux RND transporter periplasmic adaptor subunit [Halanaerobium saccharolyticum]RAK04110.1 RND family efflux transporter MFP subunit [Halanaerobium saccharolyticum]TDV97884.1 RND family efflux transporter MFP subunit [Halanaerobium saccharolyticum]TDX50987.1 RND family efflux transporter MFP subunit [Halanaerobium saccharolyticum]
MIKMIKENKLIVVTLIVLLGAVGSGIGFYNIFKSSVNAQGPGGSPPPSGSAGDDSAQEQTVAVETAEVMEGDIYIYSTVSAQSEAYEEVALTPRVQEVVIEVLVNVGDRVQTGDSLIKMDARSNQISVIQAEASLKSAEASLQEAVNGPREEEIAQLEAQLAQAESELKLRRENYERQKQLFDEGYLSQEEIDQVNNELVAAQSSYQSALKNLEMTKAGATEEEITQLESQVTQAEAELEQAKLQKSYTEINSPIKGIVAEINAQKGQMTDNNTAAIISNIDRIKLTAYVSEKNINRLTSGDQVKVGFTALEREFTGEINNISPRAATDRRSFPVEIVVENPDNIIKAGMTAQVSLPIDRAKESVIIPQNALLEGAEGYYTFVVSNGQAERRDLEISLANEDNAAVSSGLEAGEIVITLGKENLSDGSRINVVNRGDE